jgi:hypothetical protein
MNDERDHASKVARQFANSNNVTHFVGDLAELIERERADAVVKIKQELEEAKALLETWKEDHLEELTRLRNERDQWRQEHENALSCWKVDNDTLLTRAQKAEAAAGQMRYHLESINSMVDPDQYGKTLFSDLQARDIHSETDPALALDAGKGWVSPYDYAEIVAKLEDAQQTIADFEHRITDYHKSIGKVCGQRDLAVAACAKMRPTLEAALEAINQDAWTVITADINEVLDTDIGAALAARVPKLELVVANVRDYLETNSGDDREDVIEALRKLDKD